VVFNLLDLNNKKYLDFKFVYLAKKKKKKKNNFSSSMQTAKPIETVMAGNVISALTYADL
jgi:hypothetical protein